MSDRTVTITLANRNGAAYRVDRRKPLLASLEAAGVSLPYGCRYGGCISCAAKLLDGEVDQRAGAFFHGVADKDQGAHRLVTVLGDGVLQGARDLGVAALTVDPRHFAGEALGVAASVPSEPGSPPHTPSSLAHVLHGPPRHPARDASRGATRRPRG